jgi:glucose/arabinose dehydrogenase
VLGTLIVLATVAKPAEGQLRATLVGAGFTRPVGLVAHPTEANTLVVLEQAGRIRLLRNGEILAPDFLDLRSQIASGGERGLLGIAFAPDFTTSGRVFVNFTNLAGHTVIARFTRVAGDVLRADPASRFDLLWPSGERLIRQPFSNHNGGHLAFGPDGFLYVGLGDGGSTSDPDHQAQNPQSLLGKMLRLDVSVSAGDPRGYAVPSTNPFVARAGVLPEIWAFGLRNPWRYSFDDPRRGGSGALLIGDVGQGAWEEVDYEPAGASGRNYGWRNREGAHDHITSRPPFSTPLRDPIWEYGRADGVSITGGFVYRGSALGAVYRGRYFFADFGSNRVWSIALTVDPTTREATAAARIDHSAELGAAATSVASFGVDLSGELYVANLGGQIHRIDGLSRETERRSDAPPLGTARPRGR